MIRKLKRSWLTFVDDTDKESFQQAQCGCGELCGKHVEIDERRDSRKEDSESYAVEVMCADCFTKGIVDGTIVVTEKKK